ncbi:MAG: phosphohistidine phosphatase [Flavobacteriales bacterium]|nr:MAG: phosphohistidine phosphatase [Flavobacteriales bacterium]
MKTLYLCRHAKSSWADPGMSDFDRPLNERGVRNAGFMAGLFKARGEPVDLIVTSPANRAFTTAGHFATALGLSTDRIHPDRSIYLADRYQLAQVVSSLPPTAHRAMLFGHNPGFTELVEHFCDTGVGELPTCGLVRIDFAVGEWTHTGKGTGTLVWFDHPKRHPGQG